MGVCRHYCCGGDGSHCPTGQLCAVVIGNPDNSTTRAGYCIVPDNCDLVMQTGCDPGEGCYDVGDNGTSLCATPQDDVAEGEPCAHANDCVPGLFCASRAAGDPYRCRRYCDESAKMPCAAELTCVGLDIEPLPNLGGCFPRM